MRASVLESVGIENMQIEETRLKGKYYFEKEKYYIFGLQIKVMEFSLNKFKN